MSRRWGFKATPAGAWSLGRKGPRPDAGSAFVESIVAAAIVAMALGTTWRVVADGASRDRATEMRRSALLVAQSQLADVGADIPLASGDASGQSGDMVWRVQIRPYGEEADNSNPVGPLLDVTVSVWRRIGGPRLVTLRSLRLASGAPS